MKFVSYTKEDSYYEFTGENGYKMVIPSTNVITVDDTSGAVVVKSTGGRQTIGYLIK